jgi:hypothetical protein
MPRRARPVRSIAEARLVNAFRNDVYKEFQRQGRRTDDLLMDRNAYAELFQYARREHPELYEEGEKRQVDIEKGKRKDLKKIDAYLYDWAAEVEAKKLEKVTKTWIVKAGVFGGKKALASFSTGVVFDLKNKTILNELLRRGTKITGIVNKNTLRDIRMALYTSYMEKGMSPFDMRKKIKGVFEETYKNRAMTIARTESATAQSVVKEETYRRNGFKKKRWIAFIDNLTRHSHRNVTKEPIPFDQKFSLVDEQGRETLMHWSQEPTAPAREVINCRCDTEGVGDISEPFKPTWTGQ